MPESQLPTVDQVLDDVNRILFTGRVLVPVEQQVLRESFIDPRSPAAIATYPHPREARLTVVATYAPFSETAVNMLRDQIARQKPTALVVDALSSTPEYQYAKRVGEELTVPVHEHVVMQPHDVANVATVHDRRQVIDDLIMDAFNSLWGTQHSHTQTNRERMYMAIGEQFGLSPYELAAVLDRANQRRMQAEATRDRAEQERRQHGLASVEISARVLTAKNFHELPIERDDRVLVLTTRNSMIAFGPQYWMRA